MELVYHSYEPDIASFALYLWMSKTHLASTRQESITFFGFYGSMKVFSNKQFLIQSS